MKNPGEQLKLTFTRNLEPIQEAIPKPIPGVENYEQKMKAWEYLGNPDREKIYRGYLKRPGTQSDLAKGWSKQINDEVGFPMTYWDAKSPRTIYYLNTKQIEDFIQSIESFTESAQKAA